jgi:hypothetical protein
VSEHAQRFSLTPNDAVIALRTDVRPSGDVPVGHLFARAIQLGVRIDRGLARPTTMGQLPTPVSEAFADALSDLMARKVWTRSSGALVRAYKVFASELDGIPVGYALVGLDDDEPGLEVGFVVGVTCSGERVYEEELYM